MPSYIWGKIGMTEVAKFTGRIVVGKHVEMRISQEEGVQKPLGLTEVILEARLSTAPAAQSLPQ